MFNRLHSLLTGFILLLSLTSHSKEIRLEPTRLSFPSIDCVGTITLSKDIATWRAQAIQTILDGFAADQPQKMALIDMSPFIPENLDEIIADLPSGMAAIHKNQRSYDEAVIFPGDYFNFNLQERTGETLPPAVLDWSLRAVHFINEMVSESVTTLRGYTPIIKRGIGTSKMAIGGTSYTFTDAIPHTDANSLITAILNVGGDITTEYFPTAYFDRNRGELVMGDPVLAPRKHLFLMPGTEWSRSVLGPGNKALYHRAPNKSGSRFAIIQFYDRP